MKNKYVAMVLLAGSLWGFMGFFRRTLDSMGVSAIGCIAVRCIFAAALFGIVLLVSDRQAFKIKLKDIWIFFGSGIVSLFVFGVCYFKAMDYMSLSAAAILLYTAPCSAQPRSERTLSCAVLNYSYFAIHIIASLFFQKKIWLYF